MEETFGVQLGFGKVVDLLLTFWQKRPVFRQAGRVQKNPEPIDTTCSRFRADSQIRTGDLILTKDALYRLSYISTLSFDNERILSH